MEYSFIKIKNIFYVFTSVQLVALYETFNSNESHMQDQVLEATESDNMSRPGKAPELCCLTKKWIRNNLR